ncbi:hypothetical protein [Canibacter zhoujuaniae]|uniref:hypothetical protein n=1 Tax=Canibacter zhoujuaniae TaxID=2708343 RepID=UPI00141E6E99|nr:hypothetical protein [Canibacter zhoujuaniae]
MTAKAKHKYSRGRIGALLVCGAIIAGSAVFNGGNALDPLGMQHTAPAAQAAENGPGFYSPSGIGAGGFYIDSSKLVHYCLEIGIKIHTGRGDAASVNVTNVPAWQEVANYGPAAGTVMGSVAVTGEHLQALNYILTKWGQTADNQQATDVQLAVWQLRGQLGVTGKYWDYFNLILDTARKSGYTSNRYEQMVAEAYNAVRASNAATADFTPGQLSVKSASGYSGTITAPAGTTKLKVVNGKLKIDGKLVAEHTFSEPLNASATFEFVGEAPPEAGWNRYYQMSFSGSQTNRVTRTVYPGTVRVSKIPGMQAVVTSEPTPPRTETLEETKPLQDIYTTMDTLWSPGLSSAVESEFVARGASFSDTVTFFTAAESQNQWRTMHSPDGTPIYAPIHATGTLYGPFLSDPKLNPSMTVPNGAPVAGHAEVTSDPKQGAGTYSVDTHNLIANEAGYYTWVWNIEHEKQLPEVLEPHSQAGISGAPAIPEKYFFTDGFGQRTEGQTVPTELTLTTKVRDTARSIGETTVDAVAAHPENGGWLQDAQGNRVPVTLSGIAYYSASKPQRQSGVPADAVAVGQPLSVLVNSPNDPVESAEFRVPLTLREGYISFVWCVHREDQPETVRGLVKEGCDDYGIPEETFKVNTPEVATKAQAQGYFRAAIYDTAIVSGSLPDLPARISFELFKKPVAGEPKYGPDWHPVIDEKGNPVLWQADELQDPNAVCEAQPVAATEAIPVAGVGEFKSPAVTAQSYGTFYWVETVEIQDPDTGEWVRVHRGKCGIPNETTTVSEPPAPAPPLPTPPPSSPKLAATGAPSATPLMGLAVLLTAAAVGALGLTRQSIGKREKRRGTR